MEPEGSLPYSPVPATCPYSEPDLSSPCPTSNSWRSLLILSSHLCFCLPSDLHPSGFPTKTLYTTLFSPYVLHAQPIAFFSILSPEQYWVSSTDHSALCSFLDSPVTSSLLGPNIFFSALFSNIHSKFVYIYKYRTPGKKFSRLACY